MRVENAPGMPGEPLEDQVGDAVRRRAQAALAGDQALRQQLLARLHVEEFELDGEPARVRLDTADDDEIGLEQAPVLEADLLRRASVARPGRAARAA